MDLRPPTSDEKGNTDTKNYDPAEGDWAEIKGTIVYIMKIFADPAGLPSYGHLENRDEGLQKQVIIYLIYAFWVLS